MFDVLPIADGAQVVRRVERRLVARALELGRTLVEQARNTLGAGDEGVASVLAETGLAAMCSAKYAEAVRDFDETISIRTKAFGAHSIFVLKGELNEALAFARMRDFVRAEETFATADAILQEQPNDLNDKIVLLTRRGELRVDQQRYSDAIADLSQALDLARSTKTDSLPRNAPIKLGLAIAYAHTGQTAQVTPLVADAMASIKGITTCSQPLIDAAQQLAPADAASAARQTENEGAAHKH